MGSILGGGSKQQAPTVTPLPSPTPTNDQASAEANKRRAADSKSATGVQSTLLTTGNGDTSSAPVKKVRLFGE